MSFDNNIHNYRIARPSFILVDKNVLFHDQTQLILKRSSSTPVIAVSSEDEAYEVLKKHSFQSHFYLQENKGAFLRRKNQGLDCGIEDVYCLDHISGCHFSCVYCFLHSYLKKDPFLRIFVNIEKVYEELDALQNNLSTRTCVVSTGELSDSLLYEQWTHFVPYLLKGMDRWPSIKFDFRSKSSYLGIDLPNSTYENVTFYWTMNPDPIIRRYELKTASLVERIQSLSSLQKKGYSVGVLCDPIFYYVGWQKDYENMLILMNDGLDMSRIKNFFIGSLRYMKKMEKDIIEKFPRTDIFRQEFVLARDGKYRYPRPIREKIYSFMIQKLQMYGVSFQFSMEFPEISSDSSCVVENFGKRS